MVSKRIYLDNAATTAVSSEVLTAMTPYFLEAFGNPSSAHTWGREARKAMNNSRRRIAAALGCEENEIFFTSGGTESDNWAIRGAAHARAGMGKHIITSSIEHHAVLHTCGALEKEGFSVTYLPVTSDGFVTVESVAEAIRPDTILVSIMAANNEVGTIQPVCEIAQLCHEKGILFHTDAVQAVGHIPFNLKSTAIDMLSLSGHKLHAPKGIGALYIRRGTILENLMTGGAQEFGKRPGTEAIPSIVGLGLAVETACTDLEKRNAMTAEKRDYLLEHILERIENVQLNGARENRLPGNLNLSFDKLDGESVLLSLDLKGIAASSGSACTSGSPDPSHVLLAMGRSVAQANAAVRFSLDETVSNDDLDYVCDTLCEIVTRLRSMIAD